MDTWLEPEIVEINQLATKELRRSVSLVRLPLTIGRSGAFQIGSLAPSSIRKRISRVQATILLSVDNEYIIRDGNGHESQLGLYQNGRKLPNGQAIIYPGMEEIELIPSTPQYKCVLQWPKAPHQPKTDSDNAATLGARIVFLQGELDGKDRQLEQVIADLMIVTEEVDQLKEARKKDNELEAEQNLKISKLSRQQAELKNMSKLIGVMIVIMGSISAGMNQGDLEVLIGLATAALGIFEVYSASKKNN